MMSLISRLITKMLEITTEPREFYNEEKEEFFTLPSVTLHLEHSLISVSKWESKWHKPFIDNADKLSTDEIVDYIKCMTIDSKNIDDNVYLFLSKDNVNRIIEYIKDPMTATWFGKKDENQNKFGKQIITSELIYYWMVSLQIPFECQKWHLNRLLTLIKVCNVKNEEADPNKKKKMSQRALMSRNAALNAQRKAKLNSKG